MSYLFIKLIYLLHRHPQDRDLRARRLPLGETDRCVALSSSDGTPFSDETCPLAGSAFAVAETHKTGSVTLYIKLDL